ncbi:hypothetical protein [Labrys neptuniae]
MKVTHIFAFLVMGSVSAGCATDNAPAGADLRSSSAFTHHVKSGKEVEFYKAYQLSNTCDTFGAVPSVKITAPPQHGTATVVRKSGHSNYPKWNARYQCNNKAILMAAVNYRSNPGFVGKDTLKLRTDFQEPADNPPESIDVTIDVTR